MRGSIIFDQHKMLKIYGAELIATRVGRVRSFWARQGAGPDTSACKRQFLLCLILKSVCSSYHTFNKNHKRFQVFL